MTTVYAEQPVAQYTADWPTMPSRAEIEEWRREGARLAAAAEARKSLARWEIGGMTPDDVDQLRRARLQ